MISCKIMVVFPLRVMVCGPPATGVFIFIFQFARLFVVAVSVLLFQLVVTTILSPGFAQPQRLAESFCCSTIPEEIIDGNLSCASEETNKTVKANSKQVLMLPGFCRH